MMNVPTRYQVWLDNDEWIAVPVSDDPHFLHLSGFGIDPVDALKELGVAVAASIEIQLDEIRNNAGGK